MSKVTSPVMRYFGGKFRLYPWLETFFPEHTKYVEPFGGGASVLMQKPRVYAEIYNDLDSDVVNVFRVLRDPEQAKELALLCSLTPYSREEFAIAQDDQASSPVEKARRTLFRAFAGFGSAGVTKCNTGFRHDSDRIGGLTSHSWQKFPAKLQQFTDRLQGVIIENRPALDVIEKHDREGCLFYLDPPYLPETRVMGDNRFYRHEMSVKDHEAFLARVKGIEGYVILSGYDSALYNDTLIGWEKAFYERPSCRLSRSQDNNRVCLAQSSMP